MIHEFEIGLNEKVVIDENWQAYNYFRKIFKALLDETDLGMTEILQEENLNKISLETFLDRLQSFTGSTFDSCSDLIVRILFAAGIEDYSKERFFNEYYYKYINWDSYLEPIYDAVAAIHENEAVLNEIRENEARLKSRWMGGGFGIKGAIIGSLEAELLSLCESSFRQIFVTPIKKNLDKLTIENSKRELLHSKEFKELVYDAVHNSILGFFVALIDLLIRNNIIHPLNFSDVMIQHDESVRNRFENTLNFTDIKEERGGVQKLCIECIQASPYNIIYYFTLKLYDPYNTNIDSLMETLGIYEEYKKHTHILFAERIKELPSPYLIGTKEHLMKAFDQAFELADEGVDISDLKKCGNVLEPGDLFCGECGTRVTIDEPVETVDNEPILDEVLEDNNTEESGTIEEKQQLDVTTIEVQNSAVKTKLSEKTWFVILFLILFWPVGLFLMWKYKKFSKPVRIVVTIIIVAILLL